MFQNLMDDLAYGGPIGNKPEDFYFSRNTRGARVYHSRILDKRIAIECIPEEIRDQIKEGLLSSKD